MTRNAVKFTRSLQLVICTLALFAAGQVAAEGQEVYRWVDADGVVHFSQNPPQSSNYETVRPDTRKVGTVAPSKPEAAINVSSARQAAAATSEADQEPQLTAEELAIACPQARENAAALEPAKRILIPDGSGGTRELDNAERLAWLERSRNFVAENCN
jgi:hypothetical protein